MLIVRALGAASRGGLAGRLSLLPGRRGIRSTASAPSAEAEPAADEPKIAMPTAEKEYPAKIVSIVDQIEQLNLLEVADLNSLLKSRLNISDAPVMMAGAMAGGGAAAPAAAEEEEEEEAPVAVQTSFSVKLNAFDASKKVALIKELKSQVEGMNLVQAKKFVESCPAVVKADIGKDEAEALKKALDEAGADCVIE